MVRYPTENTLLKIVEVVERFDGQLLNDGRRNEDGSISLRCSRGHEWDASPYNIAKGVWCGSQPCLGERISLKRSERTLDKNREKMMQIISNRNGKLISGEYKNQNSKLVIECNDGHTFNSKPVILFAKSWCPKCQGKFSAKEHLENLSRIARSNGGELISKRYPGFKKPVFFKCAKGHIWQTDPGNIRSGHWCPECGGTVKKTDEDLRNEILPIVQARGGKLLTIGRTPEKKGARVMYVCENGHENEVWVNSLKKGHWCNQCMTAGTTEVIVSNMLYWLTGNRFRKGRYDWLRNSNGNPMELDGYSEQLNLAFEYQGQQHYHFYKFFHGTKTKFLQRQKDDKLKIELCLKRGVRLIEIPYTVALDDLQDFLVAKIIQVAPETSLRSGTYNWRRSKVGKAKELEEIKSICKSKGGICLSEQYINQSTKLDFQCAKGHRWSTVPSVIKLQGSWCPHVDCKGTKIALSRVDRNAKAEVSSICKEKDGKLLNVTRSKGLKGRQQFQIECKEGHQWITVLTTLKKGHWCQKCAANLYGNSQRLDISLLKTFAETKEGTLLSEHYINAATKLLWQCNSGHRWLAVWNSIQRGSWCPSCAGKKRFEFKGDAEGFLAKEKRFFKERFSST